MNYKANLKVFAAALAGAVGLGNFFAGAALDGGSWNWRGGTPRKRSRFGSKKNPGAPGSSRRDPDKAGHKFSKARAANGEHTSRPSYKHPHALTARPAPNLHDYDAAYRDPRVRSLMTTHQGHDVDLTLAVRQFTATPFLSKADAKLEYAGTFGNHPGMGKRLRAKIAAGKNVRETRKTAARLGVIV